MQKSASRVLGGKRPADQAPRNAGDVNKVAKARVKYQRPLTTQDDQYVRTTLGGPGDVPPEDASNFPVQLGHADPYDEAFDARLRYASGNLQGPEGVIPGPTAQNPSGGLGMPVFDDKMASYIQRKNEQMREIDFRKFAESYFNMRDPATAALVSSKILPSYYKDREAAIDQQAQLQANLAKIRARGYPQNEEELRLIFAIRKGDVKLPSGPIWQPGTWSDKGNLENARRGLFNPNRWLWGMGAPIRATADFPFNTPNAQPWGILGGPGGVWGASNAAGVPDAVGFLQPAGIPASTAGGVPAVSL